MHNGVCYYTRFMFSIEYVMYVLCWVYHQFMIVFLQLGCFVYMVWLVHACHEQYRLGGEIKMKAFKWFFKGMYGRYLHLLNKANLGKLLHINCNCNFQTIFITLHHMHVVWKIFLIYCQYQFNDNNIILITIINQNLWF